jgi:hypothetical protein
MYSPSWGEVFGGVTCCDPQLVTASMGSRRSEQELQSYTRRNNHSHILASYTQFCYSLSLILYFFNPSSMFRYYDSLPPSLPRVVLKDLFSSFRCLAHSPVHLAGTCKYKCGCQASRQTSKEQTKILKRNT